MQLEKKKKILQMSKLSKLVTILLLFHFDIFKYCWGQYKKKYSNHLFSSNIERLKIASLLGGGRGVRCTENFWNLIFLNCLKLVFQSVFCYFNNISFNGIEIKWRKSYNLHSVYQLSRLNANLNRLLVAANRYFDPWTSLISLYWCKDVGILAVVRCNLCKFLTGILKLKFGIFLVFNYAR